MENGSKVHTSTVIAALGGLLLGFNTAVISGSPAAQQSYFELSEAMLGFTVVTALIGTISRLCLAGAARNQGGFP